MLSAVIEGIDFPTPFGAHRRDTIRGSSFQKTSSSALIIWSINSIKTKDLQQSLLQCLYFLSSIGLQICWVKVILTDQKANCEQQQLQPLATVVRSRNFHYGKKKCICLPLPPLHPHPSWAIGWQTKPWPDTLRTSQWSCFSDPTIWNKDCGGVGNIPTQWGSSWVSVLAWKTSGKVKPELHLRMGQCIMQNTQLVQIECLYPKLSLLSFQMFQSQGSALFWALYRTLHI